MNKLLAYLHSPYPFFYQRWKVIVLSSLLVFLILSFFQPFGIAMVENYGLLVPLGYMGVTGGMLLIPIYLLPLLFPRYYREERWTVGKAYIHSLLIFLVIAIGNSIYSGLLLGWGLQWTLFVKFLLITTLVGLFPMTLILLLNRNSLLAFHLKEAMEMNLHLQKRSLLVGSTELEEEESEQRILFQGGSKETLEVNAANLRSVEADGNYVKITYWQETKSVQRLLRATMKQAEEATNGCPFVMKCHRAFLVNVRAVEKVSGNSQGYRLMLHGCSDEIPVSRAYAKEVKMWVESSKDG